MSSTVGFKRVLILESELTLESEPQDPKTLNRIKNNQRRSRARRKEYLQELESKVKKYERLGVEASLEMQASARLVAEENRHLRALLQSRDVMSQKIDPAIATSSAESQASSRASILEAKLKKKKPCPEEVCKTGLKSRESLIEPRDGICKRPLTSMSLRTTTTNPVLLSESSTVQSRLSSSTLTSSSVTASAFSPMNLPSHFMDCNEEESRDLSSEISSGNDTTSCTFAVEVIMSMRADVSAEDVKAELGCGKGVECNIDNSTFFTILDRYT